MTALSPLTSNDFIDLTTPHIPRLFQLGMRLTRKSCESDDLVQEALTKAWVHWARFNREGSLRAWLSRILVNTFISRYRHQRVVQTAARRSDLLDHLFGYDRLQKHAYPEQSWQMQQFSDEVLVALKSLPKHYRQVIELVDIQDLPYREAADTLGCPVGTVMSRLHRARKMLREQLQNYAKQFGFAAAA